MDWVCDHLGHTFDVHTLHDRNMSTILERVQIAKLLLIQDNNLVRKYHGKKLDDIQFEGIYFYIKTAKTFGLEP